ncbi:MAG: ABC transporter ATP-binding protein [Alphaproteobacteria bacterium]|nr:ABC transporter ATP-binding protein [Alphaproteobacteria bacterium]
MLELDDVHTYYGDSHVLQGISLTVEARTCVALLGRNGVGKSTTLRSIIGLTPARRGRITLRGEDITRLPTYRIMAKGVGFVPEDRGIFPSLTVQEHLDVAYAVNRGRSGRRPPDEIYAMFPRLAERRGNYGNQLSGGEQQMLAIGRALVGAPELLILDEPTEGLAPVIIEALEADMRRIKQSGTTMLLVEQNYEVATSLADAVYVLNQGRIQFTGTPATLEANSDVKRTYLGV